MESHTVVFQVLHKLSTFCDFPCGIAALALNLVRCRLGQYGAICFIWQQMLSLFHCSQIYLVNGKLMDKFDNQGLCSPIITNSENILSAHIPVILPRSGPWLRMQSCGLPPEYEPQMDGVSSAETLWMGLGKGWCSQDLPGVAEGLLV